jgi:hypothetical protein
MRVSWIYSNDSTIPVLIYYYSLHEIDLFLKTNLIFGDFRRLVVGH